MMFNYLPHPDWELQNFKDFNSVLELLSNQKKLILPKEEENSGVFFALSITPPQKTKVLIIGQDPYPNPDRAHGLAFSFKNNTPPKDSLKNIFTKLKEMDNYDYKNTNLSCWAQQGVLLLNTSLTYTDKSDINKWRRVWEPFITFVINKLIEVKIRHKSPLVIMLWGAFANDIPLFSDVEKFKQKNILILRSSHPSNIGNAKNKPLKNVIHSFMDPNFNHFSQCNNFLSSMGEKMIDWHT